MDEKQRKQISKVMSGLAKRRWDKATDEDRKLAHEKMIAGKINKKKEI